MEDASAPTTDQEATEQLRGHLSSEAFLTVYDRLRAEGMAIEQALILVSQHFWLRHLDFKEVLRYPPEGNPERHGTIS